ncbi:hypothetical protein H4219_004688 [Mycoemilia scoparia]|uniref:CDK5 regulatory subunit-associated protein 1 n=1 Tax=Mycoemilia scoparia TaxID=417184 RepID=A0A9W8DMF4_9FUNG|nr:hypothetical protein H4219_004688 [Mycoemilia scoparia]
MNTIDTGVRKDIIKPEVVPYFSSEQDTTTSPAIQDWGQGRRYFVEVYGCQMNVNDTEILMSVLDNSGYQRCTNIESADVIFLMTCAIRDKAEQKIWDRLVYLRSLKTKKQLKRAPMVGVLGCMAERLKSKLLETDKLVDVVCGPDAYRSLPRLLSLRETSVQGVANVMLSADETLQGIKEVVTLLGQNVNSYRDISQSDQFETLGIGSELSEGFKTIYKRKEGGRRFAELLDRVADIDPEMRIRFTSPHPKDFPDELIHIIRDRHNVCRSIHMPAQSGSSTTLQRMRRGYTREAYLALVDRIRDLVPDISISSDFITGFCGETDAEHRDTVTLMEKVGYDMAFMFAYSMREKTHAHRKYKDDVPNEVKIARLQEIIDTFHRIAKEKNQMLVGTRGLVLIEGLSRKGDCHSGRDDQNRKVFVDVVNNNDFGSGNVEKGKYVEVVYTSATSSSLRGTAIKSTTMVEYYSKSPQINVLQPSGLSNNLNEQLTR